MTRLVLVPHNRGSRSVKALAGVLSQKLGYRVFRVSPERVRRRLPFVFTRGLDKLTQLRRFQDAGVACPDFTTDRSVAAGWCRDGSLVVCRTLLRSSEGRGIVVAESEDQLVGAPLYTKYLKKKKEFRVHVLNGQVIDVAEKRKKGEFDGTRDTRIRNVANGYTFCRSNISEPQELRTLAIQATAALEYRLGAVDIVYNERSNSLYVLEVNANPGMEGTTLENYATKIIEWKENQ